MSNNQKAEHKYQSPLKTNRKTFSYRTIPLELRDPESWPKADISGQPEDVRLRFERFSRAIRQYLKAGSVAEASEECGCTNKAFYRQLNRCLMEDQETGLIVGWKALIADLRLKEYTRIKDGVGTAGKFQRWLNQEPKWRTILERMIQKGNGGEKLAGRKPDVRGVTARFIKRFKSEVALGQYPHDGKSNARRSIERYVASFVALTPSTSEVWFGPNIAKRQHLGTGKQSFNLALAPFDVVGTDAHVTDAIGVIIIDGPAGPRRIPVTRVKLIVFICFRTKVISGYSVCISPQVSARHVEEAYLMGTVPWAPKKLTIGEVKYDPGAGFPCGSVDSIAEVNPAGIVLDNAAQHYAKNVRVRLRRSLGCMISWGAVGHWWRNAVTERFFGVLTNYGFKKLPSSTGAGPGDPLRGNPVVEATGRGIEWSELIQLLDVLIANYNAKPNGAIGGVSPLDALRAMTTGPGACWLPRMRPPHTATSCRAGIEIERKRISGSVKERRPPYIEIDEVRYSSSELSPHYDWIGQAAYVHIPKDMREVEAYLASGALIGHLKCLDKGWASTAHTRDTRKAINALIREGELYVPAGGDPVAHFNDWLVKKAYQTANKPGVPKVSKIASSAANLQHEAGAPIPPPSPPTPVPPKVRSTSLRLPGIRLPDKWN